MTAEETPTVHVEMPLGQIEQSLIDQFIRSRGCDPLNLAELPAPARTALLKEASVYASAKMTEIESRSRFLDEIHGDLSAAVSSPGA